MADKKRAVTAVSHYTKSHNQLARRLQHQLNTSNKENNKEQTNYSDNQKLAGYGEHPRGNKEVFIMTEL